MQSNYVFDLFQYSDKKKEKKILHKSTIATKKGRRKATAWMEKEKKIQIELNGIELN